MAMYTVGLGLVAFIKQWYYSITEVQALLPTFAEFRLQKRNAMTGEAFTLIDKKPVTNIAPSDKYSFDSGEIVVGALNDIQVDCTPSAKPAGAAAGFGVVVELDPDQLVAPTF